MNAAQKNRLCDGTDLQEQIQQSHLQQKKERSTSLKRHNTNHSQFEEQTLSDRIDDDDNMEYQQGMHHRVKKKLKDKEEKYTTRTIFDSNSLTENNNKNSNRTQTSRSGIFQQHQSLLLDNTTTNNKYNHNHNNCNNNINKFNDDQTKISQQALKFAAENHLQPLKFECEPKINE
ncbi:unnamed protein product [Rotaria sp. Silwood1]|nr:unnamed protein product [Rotaria sp. Silwood1]CAF1645897.1 unnamed protein product [Rotaria sp. Silwood1]CAF3849597.1 unnamed protein product [Rotaria sp. Silwood1]CAF3867003.1 unnamed protein product [Rotaria sp. Silwood1]CAF4724534.1 unnamed protein product [Rotaria sp. Silwood1]